MTGVTAEGHINVGNTIQGDYVAGDKFSGDKVMGDKVSGDKVVGAVTTGKRIFIEKTPILSMFPPCAAPGTAPGVPALRSAPWRVFLSHTTELRKYPSGGSYISKAERAVSAAGHAIGDMADFAASDQPPASVCIEKVKGSDVYIGIYGHRYGSPVRDQPGISYTELEFNTATEMGIPRLVFLLDGDSEDHGMPPKALIDREYGGRQDAFLTRVQEAGLTLQRFRNPDDLKGLVERSLRELANSPKGVS